MISESHQVERRADQVVGVVDGIYDDAGQQVQMSGIADVNEEANPSLDKSDQLIEEEIPVTIKIQNSETQAIDEHKAGAAMTDIECSPATNQTMATMQNQPSTTSNLQRGRIGGGVAHLLNPKFTAAQEE